MSTRDYIVDGEQSRFPYGPPQSIDGATTVTSMRMRRYLAAYLQVRRRLMHEDDPNGMPAGNFTGPPPGMGMPDMPSRPLSGFNTSSWGRMDLPLEGH